MSQPDLSTARPSLASARKPKTTIYIILLIVALVSLLIGCLFLLGEVRRYGGFGTVRGRVSSATVSAPAFLYAVAVDDQVGLA